MSSLIQIKYGVDSNGNVLSLLINPSFVGSYKTTDNSFCLYLRGIDPDSNVPIPSSLNFQTKLEFVAPEGTTGARGAGNFMESIWNNGIYSSDLIYTIDFQSPGFEFTQTILSS